jgi:hypothetical protein
MNLYHIAIDYACQTYEKHREILSPDKLKQVFTGPLYQELTKFEKPIKDLRMNTRY